jgi:hypothetical protein
LIIKDDLGFNPTDPGLTIQIRNKLDGVKLKDIPASLKSLVDNYHSVNDLQSRLAQAEKDFDSTQEELKKYQAFVRKLVAKIIGGEQHKIDLFALEKDISDWLNKYKEKTETELLTEINALGLGLNDVTKKQVFAAISELINKPDPNEALVEKLREQIRIQSLLIADYRNGDNYMSKGMIRNKMREILKILKVETSQYYLKIPSDQSLPEMGSSFEKLLREEVNKQERSRNKLITINVILTILTIVSLLALAWGLITIRQKNNLLKLKRAEKKRLNKK